MKAPEPAVGVQHRPSDDAPMIEKNGRGIGISKRWSEGRDENDPTWEDLFGTRRDCTGIER